MPSAYILAMYALVFAGLPTTTTYKSTIITPLPADYNHTITMSSASSLTALLNNDGWLGSRVVSVLDSGAEGPSSNRSRDAVGEQS